MYFEQIIDLPSKMFKIVIPPWIKGTYISCYVDEKYCQLLSKQIFYLETTIIILWTSILKI